MELTKNWNGKLNKLKRFTLLLGLIGFGVYRIAFPTITSNQPTHQKQKKKRPPYLELSERFSFYNDVLVLVSDHYSHTKHATVIVHESPPAKVDNRKLK